MFLVTITEYTSAVFSFETFPTSQTIILLGKGWTLGRVWPVCFYSALLIPNLLGEYCLSGC